MRSAATLSLLAAVSEASLTPAAYKILPVGSVTPKGWLLKQLKLQADGLTGHLAQFWNDVMQSAWIGGGGDGGLHERTPYWLNGIVPLAFLLKNAGIDELDHVVGIYKAPWGRAFDPEYDVCAYGTDMYGEDIAGGSGYSVESELKCRDDCQAREDCYGFVVDNCTSPMTCWLKGANRETRDSECRCYAANTPKPVPVNPMAQVDKYITYILAHQNATTGWLGPTQEGGDQYWGPSNVLFSLIAYAEGHGKGSEEYSKATNAVLKHILEQKRRMETTPMTSWAQKRWMDQALSAEWLLDHVDLDAQSQSELLDLIGMLHEQGSNWEQWFEHFTGDAGNHNVNNAQAFKSAAVFYRYNSSAQFEGRSMPELSKRRMQNMDAKYGIPTGMFNGDELLPEEGYERHPSRGIELCGIVEHMFSYNTMFAIHGDPAFADRAERIAYNALPATWASPTGGDMWAHQYLQAINEINAIKATPSIWTHDNEYSETYGLEPNYGCCTANFHQGWPKFSNMLIYETHAGGAAVALYAPASAALSDGSTVDIDTQYPFGDDATITVTAKKELPVELRIPNWATKATVNGQAASNGTMWKATAKAGKNTYVVKFNPTVRLEEWDNGAVSVHRGQLLYSLPITPNYTVYAHHFGTDTMSNDYYLSPQSNWQFALDVDPAQVEQLIAFQDQGPRDYSQPGVAPFNHSGWATTLTAPVRSLPGWGLEKNSAARPPTSPACAADAQCGAREQKQLVPFGGTELRIGEFPLASFEHVIGSAGKQVLI